MGALDGGLKGVRGHLLLLLADGGEGGAGLGGLTVRRLERGRRLRGEASVDGGVRDGPPQAGILMGVSRHGLRLFLFLSRTLPSAL